MPVHCDLDTHQHVITTDSCSARPGVVSRKGNCLFVFRLAQQSLPLAAYKSTIDGTMSVLFSLFNDSAEAGSLSLSLLHDPLDVH